MIRESIFFRPRETGFRFFRDPKKKKTDRELTTTTVNLEGLESAIMDKSLGTNLYVRRF